MSYTDYDFTPDKPKQKVDSLDLSMYDSVFILFSYSPHVKDAYPAVKYSKNKNKYYLEGKIIRKENMKTDCFRFLLKEKFEAYKNEKKITKKEELLTTVHFGWIQSIVLDFNSLDWKK